MEAIRDEKNQINYRYATDNPFADRGPMNEGWVEYRMPSIGIAVSTPLPSCESPEAFFEECQDLWGEFCTMNKVAIAFTRKTMNDWDNKVPGMVKAYEDEGLSEQEIVDKIQEYVSEYNVAVPQVAKSAKDKVAVAKLKSAETEAAGVINPETGKPFTLEELIAYTKANLA